MNQRSTPVARGKRSGISHESADLLGLAMLVMALGACSQQQPVSEPSPTPSPTPTVTVETVTVPNVVGRHISKARAVLENLGFEVDIRRVRSSTRLAGTIFSQFPRGGAEVEEGATVRISVVWGPALEPPPQPPEPADEPPSADTSSEAEQAVRRYLDENFGQPGFETSWYRHISGVRVVGSRVIVATDLSTGDRDDAEGICSGTSGYVYGSNDEYGLDAVEVDAADGTVIISRDSVSESCEAEG